VEIEKVFCPAVFGLAFMLGGDSRQGERHHG